MKKIKLTQGKYTIVDNIDFEWVNSFKWYAKKQGEKSKVARNITNKKGTQDTVLLHRIIMKCPKGMEVDHIDGDPLNNQRKNLRLCTKKQNRQNKGFSKNNQSGYKGVTLHRNVYEVYVRKNNRHTFVGSHKNKHEAAKIYNKEAKKVFGKFSKLNIIIRLIVGLKTHVLRSRQGAR